MCCLTIFPSLSLVTHTTGMTHLKVIFHVLFSPENLAVKWYEVIQCKYTVQPDGATRGEIKSCAENLRGAFSTITKARGADPQAVIFTFSAVWLIKFVWSRKMFDGNNAYSNRHHDPFSQTARLQNATNKRTLLYCISIVLVSNQRDAVFVLLGLLLPYMFRTRFASIFRSNTQNCNGSHQCVSMRVWWSSPVSSGMCTLNLDAVWFGCPWG